MKRGIGWLICIAAGIAMGMSYAHAEGFKRIEIAGKVGVGATSSGGPGANDQAVSSSHRVTFIAGGAAGVRLHRLLAAQIEVLYTSKGPRVTLNGMDFGTYYLDYIEVPLLARLSLPVNETLETYAIIGPMLGVLLDADLELADGTSVDLSATKSLDFGFVFGIGAAWRFSANGDITADIRYDMGITNTDENADETDEVMNRAFYIMLGYRY